MWVGFFDGNGDLHQNAELELTKNLEMGFYNRIREGEPGFPIPPNGAVGYGELGVFGSLSKSTNRTALCFKGAYVASNCVG